MPGKTERAKVRGEVEELSLLFEISRTLDKSMELRNEVGPVLKAIAKHTKMKHGTLTLLNRATGEIFIEASYGLSQEQLERSRYSPGEGVTGKVIRAGRAAVVPHESREPVFPRHGGAKRIKKHGVSFVCVPIKLKNEVIGALSADRLCSEDTPVGEDTRLLSIIASMIAQAVRLRQEAREEKEKLLEENIRLQEKLRTRFHPSNIIGTAAAMQEVYGLVDQVSKSDTTVLIQGESGTGKELVANAIHFNSLRASRPLIKVNCAALPETVLESELFGHEKGAFTGAVSARKGRFELAAGGTVFLDEIGDFSPSSQIKLLRVLQEREFERVGGSVTLKADVRIVAATNRDLESLTEEGKFRQDLYYRLNVFPVRLPPLRERKSDILLLADHFVEKYGKLSHKAVRRISTPAIDMLMNYHWPGNVRELENCIERAVLLTTDDVIHGHHLPPTLQMAEYSETKFEGTLAATLDNVERELIVEALKSSRGRMSKAARSLGITERIMGLRVRKYSIDIKRFRTKM